MNDKYYTRSETAQRLGVSAPTVTNLTKRGVLPAVTIASGTKKTRSFYLKSEIEAYIKRLLLSTVLLTFLSSCNKIDTPTRILKGDFLPDFTVTMNDGRTVNNRDLGIGEALLVFFHTRCPDCVEELKILQPFYNKYESSLDIILISRAESEDEINFFWKENGYTMPFSAQSDRTVYEKFSDSGIPFVVFTKNGRVVYTWDDRTFFDEQEYLKVKEN